MMKKIIPILLLMMTILVGCNPTERSSISSSESTSSTDSTTFIDTSSEKSTSNGKVFDSGENNEDASYSWGEIV